MDGEAIHPQQEVKVLGVILDQALRFKQHIARAAKRGLNAAMALRRIKGMTPKTTRQLYKATVTPSADYASPIWSSAMTGPSMRTLNQAQRIGAQAIVGAFRTVSLERAEMEAGILPIRQRLEDQHNKYWIKSHTLPAKHPFWRIRKAVDVKNKRLVSPLQRVAQRLVKLDLSEMETIEPFCIPPWQNKIAVSIPKRNEAKKWAEESREVKMFVDASYRQGNAGVGLYHSVGNNSQTVKRSIKIGHCEGLTATHVELLAIEKAITLILTTWSQPRMAQFQEHAKHLTYVIASDSQAAIQQIGNPKNQSGQATVRKIYQLKRNLENRLLPNVRMQWIPAHASVVEDEIADQLAKEATKGHLEKVKGITMTKAIADMRKHQQESQQGNQQTNQEESLQESQQESHGRRRNTIKYAIDSALPGKHTTTLYNDLTYREAATLCQLRTGKSRLRDYLAKIRAVESDKCECTGHPSETVRHFLFECPRWSKHRGPLREIVGDRWGDLAFLVGGRSEIRKASGELLDGPRKSWKPDLEVVNNTIKFALATGRLS